MAHLLEVDIEKTLIFQGITLDIIGSVLYRVIERWIHMNDISEKLLSVANNEYFQKGLSLASTGVSIKYPIISAILDVLKDVGGIADEVRCDYLIHGLASGINQEKFTNELSEYIKANPKNAFDVSNLLRKAMLSNSPIVCLLMGRIIADHVKSHKAFDRSDAIIIHALESATDDDLKDFRKMIVAINDRGYIATGDRYVECLEWCVSNRICKEVRNVMEGSTYFPYAGTKPTEAARKLLVYLDEIKQLFREWD